MPLLEAESVSILTEKRLSGERKDDQLAELATRVREEILVPFLSGADKGSLRDEFERAVRRFQTIRIEANWRILKRDGVASLVRTSSSSLSELQECLAETKLRSPWVAASARWLKKLHTECAALKALVPLLEAHKFDLSQIPLEWIERWVPSRLPCAEIQSFALSCVASVLDGEVRTFNPRRLAYAVRTAAKLEPEYARLLKGWAVFVSGILSPSEKFKSLRLTLAQDFLTIWIVIAITGVRGDFKWFEALSGLCKEVFPSAGKLTLVGSRDPELLETVKLCLHAESDSGIAALEEAEPRFWDEVGKRVGPELLDLLVLSFRPALNGPATVS